MKLAKKSIIVITLSGALTGSVLAALADTAIGKPFEGMSLEDVVVIDQLPAEVSGGSVSSREDSDGASPADDLICSLYFGLPTRMQAC
jgi:hypothetical protein